MKFIKQEKTNNMAHLLVVIDTNVLVSAMLTKNNDSPTLKVLEAFFNHQIVPLYNEEIIKEYNDVLSREKFKLNKELINKLVQSICDNGMLVERTTTNEKFNDLDDLVFYEVCMSKRNEESMIVTGNIKHFPKKSFIVTPNELINIINKV